MLLVAAPGSPLRTMGDVVTALRRNAGEITFVGGSAGGVDHMLAAMVVRSLGLGAHPLAYLATSSGKDAMEALLAGRAQVAISGYSEFKAGVKSGTLVPLAVSSRRSMFGVPSLREQGVSTELANWRAVFAPAGMALEDEQRLRALVVRTTESSAWRQKMAENDWTGALLVDEELKRFVEIEQGIAAAVTMILKLR